MTLWYRARVANPEEHWEMIRVPFGMGIAGRVAEAGTSMNIPDAYACGLFNPAIDRKTGFRTRNILCCPISDMSGNHVAVIQVCHLEYAWFMLASDRRAGADGQLCNKAVLMLSP